MMKKVCLILLATFVGTFIFGCANNTATHSTNTRDGVFIHVTKGVADKHEVMMALKMAEHYMNDRDVLMYFDIKGAEVLSKDAPDMQMEPFGSSHAQIKKLLDNGVIIMACPGCLKALGKSEADLMDGIEIADKEVFFNFTKGRILTLDY